MAAPRQARAPGTPPRPATARGKKDKGTRGGRPEPAVSPAGARPRGGRGPDAQVPRPRGTAATGRPGTPGAPEAGGPADSPPGTRVPPWLWISTLLLSAGGLGVSAYLTIAHYAKIPLMCSSTGLINCDAVTRSAEAVIFHVPVAVAGLAFFVLMTAFNSPWGWHAPWPAVHWARLGSVVVGMLFVLYLIYTELITLSHICLWCTSVHVLTFLLFVLVIYSAAAGYGITQAPEKS